MSIICYIKTFRYHGHEEYATNQFIINMTGPNTLLLKKFPDAAYIICVTLFSSSGSADYPPISTSDMCVDLTVGEVHPPGGHHSVTGLLSPLLLAVAAVLLAIIIIITYIKEAVRERRKKKKAARKARTEKG